MSRAADTRPKDFLSLADWPADELSRILARAHELKRAYRSGETPQTLLGRTIAMYFEKPSLRTHVTFEAGMTQLGGHAILLRPDQVGIGTRSSRSSPPRRRSRSSTGSPICCTRVRRWPTCRRSPSAPPWPTRRSPTWATATTSRARS